MGSPVLPRFSLCTCRRHYPGGTAGCLSLSSPAMPAFPVETQVSSHIARFEACSTFTRVTARTLAESLNDPFHRRLQTGRCLPACSDCYRLERPLPGGTCTLSRTVPFHGTRFHKPLGIQSPVAEITLPFAPRLNHRIVKLGEVANNAHTLAAAAGRWLDDKRHTDRAGTVKKRGRVVFLYGRWRDWKPVVCDKVTRPDLIAHELDHVSGRTDKNKTGRLNDARKGRILGEETITRVNRTGGDRQGRSDDLIAIQIGRNGGSPGDLNRVIRKCHCWRSSIDLMIDDRA